MKRIARDKWKHFWVGLVLGLLFALGFFYYLHFAALWSILFSTGAVSIIAYGFELFSLFTGMGYYEIMDAVASVLGGLAGSLMAWLAWSLLAW